MTRQQNPDGVSRRNFLRFAGITVAAAAATGGGAAYLKQFEKAPVIDTGLAGAPALPTAAPFATSAPIISDIIPTLPAAAGGNDLYTQLAASQAEIVQLRAANDQLQRDLATYQTAEGEARTARDTLSLELDDARNRLGILGGLVALYQQLDDADMGDIIENGLGAVGEKLGELVGGVPALAAGVDAGQLALGQVEAHIPLLDNGRSWLEAQGAKLSGFYGDVEARLQRAVDRVGDFFAMLADWFESLRKWLPFGAGEKAADVMSALTALLAETPSTLSGLDVNLAQPLDVWLQRIDGEPALTRLLVKPVRDEVLVRARATIDQTNTVAAVYESNLAAPTRAALGNRRTLRQQIADYKAQNQI
jgi:hypothetical protein